MKTVTFDPVEQTFERIKHIYINASKGLKTSNKHALKQLRDSFLMYLESIRKDESFPHFVNNPEALDTRILIFYVMASNLRKGEFSLPSKYKMRTLDFTQKGWPVDANSAHFASWLNFIKTAIKIFKQYNPDLDFKAWTGIDETHTLPELSESSDNSPGSARDEIGNQANNPDTDQRTQQEKQCDALTEIVKGAGLIGTEISLPTATSSPRRSFPEALYNSLDSTHEVLIKSPQGTEPLETKLTVLTATPLPRNESPVDFSFSDWAPQALEALIISIQRMHSYGLKLRKDAPNKANVAMTLAIDLFKDLKRYSELTLEVQEKNKERFVNDFRKKLHSKDDIMSVHREPWKSILANIIIALTGVGLIAIGVKFMATGHCFFDKTQSERNIQNIDCQLNTGILCV